MTNSKVDPNSPVVRKDLDDAVDTILRGMDNMFKDPDNPMNKKLVNLETKVDNLATKVENHYTWLKDDIDGLKADLSTTVSKREFNELKGRVDKYRPTVD